ncbi:MAG: nucleotidyltransferase family protein [Pseudorhodobacter sp.]|nr:nucleotidyltransferase family protein [Pseudorhodobacter sp.]
MPVPHPNPVEIVLLAAGASSRMRGADKLLEKIDGQTQIRRISAAAIRTGCRVWVTLPLGSTARADALQGLDVGLIRVSPADGDMAQSLRAGVAAVTPGAAALILLADLVEVTEADLAQMIERHSASPGAILRGCSAKGVPGHPVLFPAWVLPELSSLSGDTGARAILARHPTKVETVPLPDNHAITDLDTPEDWENWCAAR